MPDPSPELLFDGPAGGPPIALAHGAGVGPQHIAMVTLARELASHGLRVVRFAFPYMAAGRSRPDRDDVLLDTWRAVIAALGDPARLAISGRSLGGRMASIVADECGVRALVCFAYPFHPPGKPETMRTEHLGDLRTPTLIVQGERDPFGNRDEVPGFGLPERIRIAWITDGDHGYMPRKRSGVTIEENMAAAATAAATFLSQL
ncbi:MAG: dienelactone hydrolase family protein [Spirochaetaceae bacterium]|nr:dienelactone hydrolase family protein [Spirochaetaceae bacterium]